MKKKKLKKAILAVMAEMYDEEQSKIIIGDAPVKKKKPKQRIVLELVKRKRS